MKLHFAAFRAPGARVFQSERPAAAVALAGGDVQGRRSAERCVARPQAVPVVFLCLPGPLGGCGG